MNSPIANHSGQKLLWFDTHRFKVICCGRRWGKTFYACEKLLKHSRKRNSNYLYLAPTFGDAKAIMWDHIKKRIRQLKWDPKYNESDLTIKFKNGSLIKLGTAEKPDKYRGQAFDGIICDEFAVWRYARYIWQEVLRPALSDRKGWCEFLGTPKGFNYFYDLFQSAKTWADWASFGFFTIDSPFFQTPEGLKEIEAAKNDLDEKSFKQEYQAAFESYEGRIYYTFDREVHSTDYVFNYNRTIHVGMDFNRSPMTCALYQIHENIAYQFDEIFIKFSNTEDVCKEIKRRYPNAKVIVYPDATGNRKTSNSSISDFDIIRSQGFEIVSGSVNPRKIDRWACVNKCFEKGQVKININKCKETVKDFERLCYKEGTCIEDLTDPMAGHITDASGYFLTRKFPTVERKITVGNYI